MFTLLCFALLCCVNERIVRWERVEGWWDVRVDIRAGGALVVM